MKKRAPIYFIATVWGEKFRDMLCDFAIASLLSKNNIVALKHRDNARFVICTTRHDFLQLHYNPIFQLLLAEIKIEFIENDETFPGEHKYNQMSRGHALLAEYCYKNGAIAFNVNPDSIYPDGTVEECERLAEEGKKVVLCTAVRFDQDGLETEFKNRGLLKKGQPLSISKRDALDAGLRHLHSETRAGNWDAPNFGRLSPLHNRGHFLTCCYWTAPGENGIIIITHNWAPLIINYTALQNHDVDALDGRALDGNYIYENFKNSNIGDDLHIVTDSDSLFLLGMTPKNEMIPTSDRFWWKESKIFSEWSRGYILNQTIFDPHMDDLKLAGYKVPVYWHARDLSEKWDPISDKVDRLLGRYGVVNLTTHKGRSIAPVDSKFRILQKPLNFIRRALYIGLNSAVVLPVNAPIWSASWNANYSLIKSFLVRAFHFPNEFKQELKNHLRRRSSDR